MGFFQKWFGGTKPVAQKRPVSMTSSQAMNVDIRGMLKEAKASDQLPELNQIVDALVAVEEKTNYATLVEIALKTAAECRGVYIGELKSAYMKLWWQWHNHRDDPRYRAKKVIVIAGEAAQVHPDSEIGWMLISILLVWFGEGCPDRSSDLTKHLGNVPSLDEIQQYQSAHLGA